MKKLGIITTLALVFSVITGALFAGQEAKAQENTDTQSFGSTQVEIVEPLHNATFEVGQEIQFSAFVSGIENANYTWQFGDGTTASDRVVKKTYNKEGSFQVVVWVGSGFPISSDTITVHIVGGEDEDSVDPDLDVSIHVPQTTIEVDDSLTFTAIIAEENPGTSPISYVWKINGANAGTAKTMTKTFISEDEHTVSVTATDSKGKTDTAIVKITVIDDTAGDPNLDVSISVPQTTIEVDDRLIFTAVISETNPGTAPYSYQWKVGVTDIGQNKDTLSKLFAKAGTFVISITVTDANGRTDTDSVTITVVEDGDAPKLDITLIAPQTTIEKGDSLTFTAEVSELTPGTPPYTFTWKVNGENAGTGSTLTRTFNSTGQFTVAVTATDSKGMTDSDSAVIIVEEGDDENPNLDVSISVPQTTIEVDDRLIFTAVISETNPGTAPYSYQWKVGVTDIGQNKDTLSKLFAKAGTFVISITVTDANGRTDTDSVTITVVEDGDGDNLDVSIDVSQTTIEEGETLQFSADISETNPGTAPYDYIWKIDGDTVSTNESFSNTFNNDGTFVVTLTVTDDGGETDTDSVTIIVTEDGGGDPDLVISNVQVSNVTQNSATITWTTNLSADSRVIYDTVSHGDISGQSAPNFGYQFSTATFNDETGVTSHSVQLTGLQENTQYFFRVLSREIE